MAVKRKKAAVRRKRVSGTPKIKAVAGVKRRKRISAVPKKRSVVSGVKPMSKLQKGNKIIGQIEAHEKKYRNERNKERKHLLALEINNLHDNLDALKRQYKRM